MKSQILTWSLIKTPDPVFTDLWHSTPMNVSRIRNKTLNTWHQTISKLILAKETDNFMASNIFRRLGQQQSLDRILLPHTWTEEISNYLIRTRRRRPVAREGLWQCQPWRYKYWPWPGPWTCPSQWPNKI